MRSLFPLVREAVARVLPVERLRWIGFAHVEADECGAVNDFLGGSFLDALTAPQVAERAQLSPAQIVERFTVLAPRAARGRRRTPGFVRRRTIPDPQPVGGRPESSYKNWTFRLLDRRDPHA